MTRLTLLVALCVLAAWSALPNRCLVCGETLTGTGDTVIRHRGREVAICARAPCLPAWTANAEQFFRRVQARSALFDEEAMADRQVSAVWIVVGLSMLLATLVGAVWGYLAIGRKVPVTHAPRSCPHCKVTVHPSATECSACGAQLQATIESEIARA
ncbi:MAG: hypothetical protein ACYS0D_07410 [Planctomycetota bacterium]|jgi:hypothetical protein